MARGGRAGGDGCLKAQVSVEPGTKPPSIDRRRKAPEGQRDVNGNLALPGQVLNEHGEWEDEASYLRLGEEAKGPLEGDPS